MSGIELFEEIQRIDVDDDAKGRMIGHFERVFGDQSVFSVSDTQLKEEKFRISLSGTRWVIPELSIVFDTTQAIAQVRNTPELLQGRPHSLEILLAANGYALMRTKMDRGGGPFPIITATVDGSWQISDDAAEVRFLEVPFDIRFELDKIRYGDVPINSRSRDQAFKFGPAEVNATFSATFGSGNVPLLRQAIFEAHFPR